MQITEEEVEYEDIMWFAVDNIGNIAMFTSGVYGNVPTYVCESRERVNILIDYFCIALQQSTDAIILRNNLLDLEYLNDYKILSQKGIFCYDAFDGINHLESYLKITEPVKPLMISDLPTHIRNIITRNKIEGFVSKQDSIFVSNAY